MAIKSRFYGKIFIIVLANAVVKWIAEVNQFSIVKMSEIAETKPALEQIYQIFFDGAHLKGQIKYMGCLVSSKLKLTQFTGSSSPIR